MATTSAHGPRLELRQSQSLVMTQSLQQSIKLLQMNALELRTYVEAQLEQNPLLSDEAEEIESTAQDTETPEDQTDPIDTDTDAEFLPQDWRENEAGELSAPRDGSELRMQITARDSNGDEAEFEDSKARDISLQEHLAEQLEADVPDPLLRAIGMYLIDLIDDAGYLKEELSIIAEQLGTDEAHIQYALDSIQRFDPCGVGARNLAECLSLQLREKDRFDPAMQTLVANLPLLAEGNIPALERLCGVDAEDVRQMIAELRALNPKPGLAFAREVVETVVPDVTVRRDFSQQSKKSWHIELNASALPRVLVNRRYFAKISAHAEGADKKYLNENLQQASWLVRALDQRAQTILKVSTEIVVQQEGFFRMGIHHLKPLTLRDIARETGFHESTISRVTTGKYMITPRGTFELKYFFTSGLSHGAGGDDVSSQTAKHLIKELIAQEGAKVLSDDDIAETLRRRNINVARRTVAKYREAIGIASSMERRRQRNLSNSHAKAS